MKDFLLSDKSREFFVFLFFFFVAGGFWLLQTLNNDYETEFVVPVRLKGVPENVVVTSEPVSEIHIRVQDKGTVLLNYMLGKSFFPVTLNFEESGQSNRIKVGRAQFEKKITSQLNTSTRLLAITPDTLEYIYSTGKGKQVPVRLRGNVGAGQQYYLSDTIFTPDSVTVYAPAEVLDTITAAYTQWLFLENVTDTIERHVYLDAPKGAKFVPTSTKVTLPVDIYTEKTVEVPLHGINFPADKALRAFPSKVQVTFQVGMGRFRQIDASDFHIVVSYEELLQLGTEKYKVKLRKIPEGVSKIRFNPEQVDFLIEQIPLSYD